MRFELLLLLLKHYANNPANYILPQYIKTELRKEHNQRLLGRKYDYYIVKSRANETACGATADGLLAVLGNSSNTLNKILFNKDEISTPDDFKALKRSMIAAGTINIDDRSDSSEFLIYQFTIEGYAYQRNEYGGHNSHTINHIFSIIQYKNPLGELNYCMLQSYAGEQSLLQFIDASEFNNTLVMAHDEMIHFLNKLEEFVNAKVIDDNITDFYRKYFKVRTAYQSFNLCRSLKPIYNKDNGLPENIEINHSPLLLNVQWTRCNMQTVCNNLRLYITKVQQQDNPQIIEIPENCDNQLLQPFSTLMRQPAQQNPPNPINLLIVDPFSGQLTSKTIDKTQLPIIEALQSPKKMVDIKYPASKNETLRELKKLIDEANSVSEFQYIFDIACVCVNQHQNTRWDSFWGIQNTSSLREIITIIRDKALTHLFTTAPSENSLDERILHFTSASKMSLFNKHKNNFKITGAFGRTHALKVIDDEIDRLKILRKSPQVIF